MKRINRTLGVAIAVTALALCATRPSAAQAVTDLGLHNGYDTSFVMAISNSGMAVGAVINTVDGTAVATRAAVWMPGAVTATLLPLLSGYTDSSAMYVNATGMVAGVCANGTSSPPQACAWNVVRGRWVVRSLGLLPGTLQGYAVPFGVNVRGQIIGMSQDFDTGERAGFIWDVENGMQAFTNLSDGRNGASVTIFPAQSHGIGDNGLVVGKALAADGSDNGAIIWNSVSGQEALHLQDGEALAISPSGKQVVGYQPISEAEWVKRNLVSWSWDDLQEEFVMSDLGVPAFPAPPEGESVWGWIVRPTAVTDDGRIIGDAECYYGTTGSGSWDSIAYIDWIYSNGVYTDLATVLPASESGSIMTTLINANGLVAIDTDRSGGEVYLWNGEGTAQPQPDLGDGSAMAVDLNDDGLIVGYARVTTDSVPLMHGVLWSESGLSALKMSAAMASVKGKTLTVTVKISANNPNNLPAADITVTSAALNGADTTALLPLSIGTLKVGASKTITLTFDSIASGQEVELKIEGTCSLGKFFTTQTVTIK